MFQDIKYINMAFTQLYREVRSNTSKQQEQYSVFIQKIIELYPDDRPIFPF